MSFELGAPNEQLARLKLAKAMAEAHDDRDHDAWRDELLNRRMWLAIDKAFIIQVDD